MSFRAGTGDADLPPVGRSLRRSMALAYRAEPRLLVVSFLLIVGSWIPVALGALWLKQLVDGILAGRDSTVRWACAGLAAAAAAGWLLRTVGQRVEHRFRDRATIEIEAHVARMQATVSGLEHHERPELLDRLQLLREQVFLLNHIYASLMNGLGSVGQLAVTVALLMSVHPALIGLLVFAVPPLFVSTWRAGVERRTQEGAAPHQRLARHLFDLATAAGPGKELRVGNAVEPILARRDQAYDRYVAELAAARRTSALWHSLSWTLFGAGYVAAIVFVAAGLDRSAGDVLLVVAAGANLSRYLGQTVGQAEFFRWTLDASQRLVWLEQYAAERLEGTDGVVPTVLHDGIRLDNVSFQYPGTDKWVLRDVDLDLPAGTVVALVGENGAGKTTLVKLLCRFYDPSEGTVSVDGIDLRRLPAHEWRSRLAGAFQDFYRFEYEARSTIGVGDLERVDDLVAVEAAVERAGAADVVARLPEGLDTQLGPTWANGVELSIGQWQKLALARGLMRDHPLMCILDEPTASLDAETEHALFERFAEASRTAREDGRITVLVSHRFSTVRMADLIVVLDGAHIVETGSHADLVRKGGTYAELYEMQARAYR